MVSEGLYRVNSEPTGKLLSSAAPGWTIGSIPYEEISHPRRTLHGPRLVGSGRACPEPSGHRDTEVGMDQVQPSDAADGGIICPPSRRRLAMGADNATDRGDAGILEGARYN